MPDSTPRQPTRLLYLMHVDWNWIKQRPHFLAEELQLASVRVLVLYVPAIRRHRLRPNPSRIWRFPLPVIPRWSSPFARLWNAYVGRFIVGLTLLLFQPTTVWITFPALVALLPTRWRRPPIHYDAMDISDAFDLDPRAASYIRSCEEKAVRLAGSVTCSSQYIQHILLDTCAVPSEKLTVVRNAFDSRRRWDYPRKWEDNGVFRIAYVGTISSWLDFDCLAEVLDEHPTVEIDLYGPLDIPWPNVTRLHYRGIIPQHDLQVVTLTTDCFVMPFRVTELVRGVDPVKLYEYLAMRRPVICRWYEGLSQFGPFVDFYHSSHELPKLVERVMKQSTTTKIDNEARLNEFLAFNDWRARGAAVLPVLSTTSTT